MKYEMKASFIIFLLNFSIIMSISQNYSIYSLNNLSNNLTEHDYLDNIHNISQSILGKYSKTNNDHMINLSIYNSLDKIQVHDNGEVDKNEKEFLKMYACYKAEGGKLQYNELKIEYLKRKFPFIPYFKSSSIGKNIFYNYTQKSCAVNSVCINKNGYILKSEGINPKNILINNFHFLSKSQLNLKVGTDSFTNEFDLKYILRRTKMRKKKEIIINRIFDIIPLVAEILALANVEKIKEITDYEFLRKEALLLKRYLIMWDPNCGFVDHASKLLLNIILCNNEQNQLRAYLGILMEGLCFGDDRSIKIFKEIVITLIMDTIIKTKFYYFNDLMAKNSLVKVFNKPFCFRVITKLKFIEGMMLSPEFKEKLTFIIMKLDTNNSIDYLLESSIHTIPAPLANNTIVQNYEKPDLKIEVETPERRVINLGRELLKAGLEEANKKNEEKRRKLRENVNFRKNSNPPVRRRVIISNQMPRNNLNFNSIHQYNVGRLNNNRNLKSAFNFKNLETKRTNQIKIESRSDYENYLKKMNEVKEKIKSETSQTSFNETFEDMPKLEEFDTFYQKGVSNRTIYPKLRKHVNNLIRLNEILDFLTPTSRVIIRNGEVVINFKETQNKIYNNNRFKSISSNNLQTSTNSLSTFTNLFLDSLKNEYPNPPTKEDLIAKMMSNPETRQMIENALKNPKNKIVYSDEIHSKYVKAKLGRKKITIDKNKNTKKLITDNLFEANTFNDLMNQQEIDDVDDPTGLFIVLKNIQHRKCSCGYICIEIGTIYGDFDSLKPKNVTVETVEKENIHLIIKPVIIVNSTGGGGSDDGGKNITSNNISIDGTKIKIFDDGECDDLKISGNYPYNMLKFKEKVTSQIEAKANIQRKFYRKVQIGEEIYAKEIFKQGLNMILIDRNRKYSKAYERTFDTNNNALESDEMADIIQETGCNKIIVITGIGKWMGAITPKLVKKIMEIGGPNINRLITADYEDNEMADHAFILIGRKGLCAYNGVLRVKNYDISRELRHLYPNLSSDPNDCYFEDVSLENLKNKQSELVFYHAIDLRLTLNLNVDNRFSFTAPTVSQVLPIKGHVRGGTEIQIGGFNFPERTSEVWEILIRGVPCKNIVVLSPNQIKCITGESDFMGAGFGNAIIKLKNGLSSPSRTCNMFQYYGTIDKKIEAKVNIHVNSTLTFPCYEDRHSRFKKLLLNKPCFPVYTNSTVRGTYLIIKKN